MLITWMHENLCIASPAKLNLFLELKGKRPDGFHEIETVMSTVSLFDQLKFSMAEDQSEDSLGIRMNSPGTMPQESDVIPTDRRNLVLKAIQLVRLVAVSKGVNAAPIRVQLLKSIPSAAGLGGASSNAAAALIAANRLWKLNLAPNELSDLAAQLGSDVPFFLVGGTAMCSGRGEIITPIDAPASHHFVIAKPPVALSTRDVFSHVSKTDLPQSGQGMLNAVQAGDRYSIQQQLFNRLTESANQLTNQVNELAHQFDAIGCQAHQMSGSGSSYFGIFPSQRSARSAAKRLGSRNRSLRVFSVRSQGGFKWHSQNKMA